MMQLYAQYFSMIEMGYEVKKLKFYSMEDNKMYPIKLPYDDFDMYSKLDYTQELFLYIQGYYILCDIENLFSKQFGEADSVYIFKLSTSCQVIRYGYAKHEEEDVIIIK